MRRDIEPLLIDMSYEEHIELEDKRAAAQEAMMNELIESLDFDNKGVAELFDKVEHWIRIPDSELDKWIEDQQ